MSRWVSRCWQSRWCRITCVFALTVWVAAIRVLWDWVTPEPKSYATRGNPVKHAATVRNGVIWADEDAQHTIRLFKLGAEQCLVTLTGHTAAVQTLAVSPSRELVATASADGMLILWSGSTGECLASAKPHPAGVWATGFSPDGRTLVTSGCDRTVRLWDVPTLTERTCIRTTNGTVTTRMAFSPDGTELAVAHSPDSIGVEIYATASGALQRVIPLQTWFGFCGIAYAPDGKSLAVGCGEGDVRILDPLTGKERARHQVCDEELCAVNYSPDGRLLAVTGIRRAPVAGLSHVRLPSFLPPEMKRLFIREWLVFLIDSSTGHERGAVPGTRRAMFVDEGMTLVTDPGGYLSLWDVPPSPPLGRVIAWSLLAPFVVILTSWTIRRWLRRRAPDRHSLDTLGAASYPDRDPHPLSSSRSLP
jgi:WD40 repeat protein